MPRLFEQEKFGAIGMLKAGVRVSDVARYHYCHPSTIQCLRDRYKATGTVKPLSHWTATVLRQLATDIASGSQSSLETVASDS